jgi:2-desacetyl-2-hydroxyethyl bacteriochlorophyllide A dehydrogenase
MTTAAGATMKAMAVVDYAGPLRLVDVPLPQRGPGDVLVHIRYCGVCGSDVKIARGTMGFSAGLPLPHVAGHEIVGVVDEAGRDARVRPGTRVVVYDYETCGSCPSCRAGRGTTCGSLRRRIGFTDAGGFAEGIVVPWQLAVPLPDAIDDRSASALSCAIATAYRGVVTRGRVGAGERVLVSGVGGVGIHAAQIARLRGARVIAADPSAAARQMAGSLGLETADPADLAVPGAGRRAEAGYDAVIETSGDPAAMTRLASLLNPGGRIVLVGYSPGRPGETDAESLVLAEAAILGSRFATRADLIAAVNLLASGAIRSVVTEEFAFGDANRALEAVRAGRAIGRVTVRVS